MKISVCIPTYNQSQYLAQAVKSAYNQSFKPLEIIISDDCSTDSTRDVMNVLASEIPVLRIFVQPVNLGIAGNTDHCLRMATGDYIVRLDSDDYLAPHYLEKLSALLEQNPNAGYAHSAVQEVNQGGDYILIRQLARKSGYQNAEVALHAAVKGYRVSANIIMFTRKALQKVNYISDRPNYVEDYHLSASLAAAGFGNVYINEVLCFYRVWVDAGKARLRRKLMEIVGIYKVYSQVLEPAFKERNWSLKSIKRNRTIVASVQADCLSWNVYSTAEKMQLKEALGQLSSSPRAKVVAWLYLNGYGQYLNVYSSITWKIKSKLKEVYIKLRY